MINFLITKKTNKKKDKSVLQSKDLPKRDVYQKKSERFQGNNSSDHLQTTAFTNAQQKSKAKSTSSDFSVTVSWQPFMYGQI